MPVSSISILKGGGIILIPLLAIYGYILSPYSFFYLYPNKTIYIYIIMLLTTILMMGAIEKLVFIKLTETEKTKYFESIYEEYRKMRKGIYHPKICTVNLGAKSGADYIQNQFEYYLRKSLEAHGAVGNFLVAITGGIILDISLSAFAPNVHSTSILMGVIAFSSTIYMFFSLLKYAEYNAGCAIYRNGILGKEICQNSFLGRNFDKKDLEDNIAKTLYLLRSREGCEGGKSKPELNLEELKLKDVDKPRNFIDKIIFGKTRTEKIESFELDSYLTVELLVWFDIIKEV